MDDQNNQANGAAGAVETRPSFVSDVEHVAERIGEGLRDDAEELVDRVLGTGTAARLETAAADIAGKVESEGAAAIAALKALGAGHVNLTQIGVTAELAAAKTKIEEALIAIARHFAALS